MNDERDLNTRQTAREDRAVWLSQHAAWAKEVERQDEIAARLSVLVELLERTD